MGGSVATSIKPRTQRIIQNFHLCWLDANSNCDNSITKLRQVVNTTNTFVDAKECIDFINKMKHETAFMILSDAFEKTTMSTIHDKKQVNTIYIFSQNKTKQHEQWIKEWPKVNGVFEDIDTICKALKQAVHDYDHNAVSISFAVAAGGISLVKKDTLDSSFMFTEILKDILLTIDFEQKHIDTIEKEYSAHQPIWWYTRETILYSMVNRALRLIDIDIILKIGFFIRDLHKNIVSLHSEQFNGRTSADSFIVYRGQTLSQTDFKQLKQNQGDLLTFNNFLSTNKNRNIALEFIDRNLNKSNDLVPVLFVMHIDPSIKSTPFANIDKMMSGNNDEETILFSLHSVFRIGQIKELSDTKNPIWEVELILTDDNDPELHRIAENAHEATTSSSSHPWHRLVKLLIKSLMFEKAEELCQILLKQTNDQHEKAYLFQYFGMINDGQGKYAKALEYYDMSLAISKPNHPDLATLYSNIGLVYYNIGMDLKALEHYEKSLEIRKKILPINHIDLAASYNSIGMVYFARTQYVQALEYFEKTLEIYKKTNPLKYSALATSYNNIGMVYSNMRQYAKALEYYNKSLEINQKVLSTNHPDLATAYNNIGMVYDYMNEYSKALQYYEKALELCKSKQTIPGSEFFVATIYNNIGWVYKNMGNYKDALDYYQRALAIRERFLPINHPNVVDVKKSIEVVKQKL